MSLASGPSRAASRSFSSPAALLVKVMAMISQGLGASRAQSRPADVLLRGPGGEALQKLKILFRGPGRHLFRIASPAVGQQVVHPLDQHRGLAAAGARQQQQRTLRGHGSLALHGVQPG